MELASGDTQDRFAKEGDPGWEEYQDDLTEWDTEKLQLQEAAKFVTSLRDYQFPDPLAFPKHTQDLIDAELLTVPKNVFLRKMMWLRAVVLLSQNDEVEIAQIKKLRRRIEDYSRKTTITMLIKAADLFGIKIQKGLEKYRQ